MKTAVSTERERAGHVCETVSELLWVEGGF